MSKNAPAEDGNGKNSLKFRLKPQAQSSKAVQQNSVSSAQANVVIENALAKNPLVPNRDLNQADLSKIDNPTEPNPNELKKTKMSVTVDLDLDEEELSLLKSSKQIKVQLVVIPEEAKPKM